MGDVVRIRPRTIPPSNLYEQVQVQLHFACMSDVSEQCDISVATLHRWKQNEVENPYYPNVLKVAVHLGLHE